MKNEKRCKMADVRRGKTKVLRILFGRFENFAYLCKQSEQGQKETKKRFKSNSQKFFDTLTSEKK